MQKVHWKSIGLVGYGLPENSLLILSLRMHGNDSKLPKVTSMACGNLFLVFSLWTVPLSLFLSLGTLELSWGCTAAVQAIIKCWAKWGLYKILGQHRHLWFLHPYKEIKYQTLILLHWQNYEHSMDNVSKSPLIYGLVPLAEYRFTLQHEFPRYKPGLFLIWWRISEVMEFLIICHVTLNNVTVYSW